MEVTVCLTNIGENNVSRPTRLAWIRGVSSATTALWSNCYSAARPCFQQGPGLSAGEPLLAACASVETNQILHTGELQAFAWLPLPKSLFGSSPAAKGVGAACLRTRSFSHKRCGSWLTSPKTEVFATRLARLLCTSTSGTASTVRGR